MSDGANPSATLKDRARRLLPGSIRRTAAGVVASRRASSIERQLAALAAGSQPILAGPWLGEVGFELLYWIPFLRWFTEHYGVAPERVIAVSRGGSAAAWYGSIAGRTHDALAFMSPDDFKRRNEDRRGRLGEQKQIAPTPLDDEIVQFVRGAEGETAVLHPSTMYRLFAPYWWGHQPIAWVRQYTRFTPLVPPALAVELPAGGYVAVKFYFNDCFRDTPGTRAWVDRTVRELAAEGRVISLSTGVAVDDHAPCEPDIAAMQGIQHLLSPQSNLLVQSAIVARARRFVGTYGGFAYLAPLCGVTAHSYYTDAGTFSTRHLDLIRDVLDSQGQPDLLHLAEANVEPVR